MKTATDVQMDTAATLFVNHLWEQGMEKHDATRFYAALLDRFPRLSGSSTRMFPRCRRALQGWTRLEPSVTRPPLPLEIAAWVAKVLLEEGVLECGLLVILMFSTYCRPAEALALHVEDWVVPV